MSEEKVVIEVCLGVGTDQLFPETIVIQIEPSEDDSI